MPSPVRSNTEVSGVPSPSRCQPSVPPLTSEALQGDWQLLVCWAGKAARFLLKEIPAVLHQKLHQHVHLHTSNRGSQSPCLTRDQAAFPTPAPCSCPEPVAVGLLLQAATPTAFAGGRRPAEPSAQPSAGGPGRLPRQVGTCTLWVTSSMASSGSRSAWAGLSRFGPTQTARLLQPILLVAAWWPMCWRRDSSRFRRRRLAAGNFSATLGEQEHGANKADVAHSVPQTRPRLVGASAAFQVLWASGQGSCSTGRLLPTLTLSAP